MNVCKLLLKNIVFVGLHDHILYPCITYWLVETDRELISPPQTWRVELRTKSINLKKDQNISSTKNTETGVEGWKKESWISRKKESWISQNKSS